MRSKLLYKLIILGLFIGLLLTAQWKTPQKKSANPVATFAALRDTSKDMTREQLTLKKEIQELRDKIDIAANASRRDNEMSNLVNNVEEIKTQAGLSEIKGAGLELALNDANNAEGNPDNITHAADLRDIVNVLWGAGAQAISINGERIVANTSIDCVVNTILINSTKTTAPFSILTIGDPKSLSVALYKKENLPDLWGRVSHNGVIFTIKMVKKMTIMPFSGSYNIKWAKKAGI